MQQQKKSKLVFSMGNHDMWLFSEYPKKARKYINPGLLYDNAAEKRNLLGMFYKFSPLYIDLQIDTKDTKDTKDTVALLTRWVSY